MIVWGGLVTESGSGRDTEYRRPLQTRRPTHGQRRASPAHRAGPRQDLRGVRGVHRRRATRMFRQRSPTIPAAAVAAGWGFMVLTNMLPNQGNGTYLFFVYAQDREGHTTLLGTRTMTCANASATLPFGAIDTPTQGGVATGASYVNFGWALTPLPKLIPTDGSTIGVLIDGASIGTVDYNHPRPDIRVAVSWTQQHERRDRVPGHRYDDADERAAYDLVDGRRQSGGDRRDRQPVLHRVERRGRADGGAGDDHACSTTSRWSRAPRRRCWAAAAGTSRRRGGGTASGAAGAR